MRFFIIAGMISMLSGAQACFADSNPLQLFVEPEAGREPMLQAISHAHQEIDIMMYLWTDRRIASALVAAADRGVQVKVILEKAPYEGENANAWLSDFWHGSKIEWHWAPETSSAIHYFHEKSLMIDHQDLWVMTSNFVNSSFSRKYLVRNFILEDSNPRDVSAAESLFDQDWQNMHVSNLLPSDLVVSPINSREQLTELVRNAKHTLEIYTDGMDDYEFIGALAKAAERGVSVNIICGGKLQEKAKKYLQQAGVILKQLNQNTSLQNHAKVIIADQKIAFVGSENFTQNSFDQNRELGLKVMDPAIVASLHDQFGKDFVLVSSQV